jgi:hypothetical protein
LNYGPKLVHGRAFGPRGSFLKQELLLKSQTPNLDAALERTVRTVLYVAAVIFWVHEIFAPSEDRSRD